MDELVVPLCIVKKAREDGIALKESKDKSLVFLRKNCQQSLDPVLNH